MNKDFFVNNRKRLFNELPDKSIVVITAGDAPNKSADESYLFTPNRNFYYLTGINETKDVLIMIKDNNILDECLIISKYDELKSKWVGKTLSKDEAINISGINNIHYHDENNTVLTNIISNTEYKLYIDKNANDYDKYLNNIKSDTLDVYPILTKLRMVKCDAEIELIKKANEITNKGLDAILDNLKPGLFEYQVESHFDQTIKYNNASGFAFRTIAASGVNACVLHYDLNNCVMNKEDLVLFDLGAEFNYYKSDISRTYPVSGKYSDKQKQIYNIVLEAQNKVIAAAKPGLSTKDLNNIVIKFYEEKLMEIGLINNPEDVKKYYYHGVSHHLGLDTHDIAVAQPLEAGNVITVEPGLYIEELNIGIRIEDDILITKDGNINLSSNIKKTVEEIEKYMNRKK